MCTLEQNFPFFVFVIWGNWPFMLTLTVFLLPVVCGSSFTTVKDLRSAGSYAVGVALPVWNAWNAWPLVAPPVAWCLTPSSSALLDQSRAVRRSRGLDSTLTTLSHGDKDPPVPVRFMRTLVSHSRGLSEHVPAAPVLTRTSRPSSPLPSPTSPHHRRHRLPVTVLLEPAGNPPVQPVLCAPDQSRVIIQLHRSILPEILCPY